MTVYNGEKYIREAIDSILNQTFSDFEYIIIDDGSKDNSVEIVRSYTDKRIRFYENDQNRGICYSSNRGIALAEGEFIARFDCDDISDCHRLEKEVAYLEEHKDVMICGSWKEYLVDGKTIDTYNHPIIQSDIIKMTLLFDNYLFTHSTILFRHEDYLKSGFSYEKYIQAHDYYLMTQMAGEYSMHIIPEQLVQYRINPDGISATNTNEKNQKEALAIKLEYLDSIKVSEQCKSILKCSLEKTLDKKETRLLKESLKEYFSYWNSAEQKTEYKYAKKMIVWDLVRLQNKKNITLLWTYLFSGWAKRSYLCSTDGLKWIAKCMIGHEK